MDLDLAEYGDVQFHGDPNALHHRAVCVGDPPGKNLVHSHRSVIIVAA